MDCNVIDSQLIKEIEWEFRNRNKGKINAKRENNSETISPINHAFTMMMVTSYKHLLLFAFFTFFSPLFLFLWSLSLINWLAKKIKRTAGRKIEYSSIWIRLLTQFSRFLRDQRKSGWQLRLEPKSQMSVRSHHHRCECMWCIGDVLFHNYKTNSAPNGLQP